jgi:UrcA family protein
MSKRALTIGLFFAAAGIACAAGATTTAPNSTEPESSTVTVRYHKDELATSRGVQSLYAAIDRAARDVCDDPGDFVLRSAFAPCEQKAIVGAVEQVDNANLTEMYNRHYPSKRLTEAVSWRLQPTIVVVAG